MRVKTIKAHTNGYGEKFVKKVGDVYEHPNPLALIASKFVKEATDVRGGTKGRARDGARAVHTQERDSEKSDPKGDAKSTRADERPRSSKSAEG